MKLLVIFALLVVAFAAPEKRFIFSNTKITNEVNDKLENKIDSVVKFNAPLIGGFTDHIFQSGKRDKRDVVKRGTTIQLSNNNKFKLENIFNAPLYGDIKAVIEQHSHQGKRDVEKRGTTIQLNNNNKFKLENIFNAPLYGDIKAVIQQHSHQGKRDADKKDKRFIFSKKTETTIVRENTLNEIKKLNHFGSVVIGDVNMKWQQEGKRSIDKRFLFNTGDKTDEAKTEDLGNGCKRITTMFSTKVVCTKQENVIATGNNDGCKTVKTAWGTSIQCNSNTGSSSSSQTSVSGVTIINGKVVDEKKMEEET